MYTSLVSESTITAMVVDKSTATDGSRNNPRDGIHEGDIDFDGLSDQVLDFTQH